MTLPAPVLVLAVGNPSRGDDALGPETGARLERAAIPGVQVLTEFQLQVENALDLEGRELVVIVDAGSETGAPFELREVRAAPEFRHTSHALSPEALLATFERVTGRTPPATWLLCVRGDSFGLGDGLSGPARNNLEFAWARLLQLCLRGSLRPQLDQILTDSQAELRGYR